jgi:hypothetical protein
MRREHATAGGGVWFVPALVATMATGVAVEPRGRESVDGREISIRAARSAKYVVTKTDN